MSERCTWKCLQVHQLLILSEPLASKLCYHHKLRPKDQRTHAKNLQTPQVNAIKPFHYIDVSFGVIFVLANASFLHHGIMNVSPSFLGGSGLIDSVIGHGLLAGNPSCQRSRFANQPIADVSWRAPARPPNIRICFNEGSSCKIRWCGGRRPHTVRDSYAELIDTSAGWISCTRKISLTESVENILAHTNGN